MPGCPDYDICLDVPTEVGCPEEPGSITINKVSDDESNGEQFTFHINESTSISMGVGGSDTFYDVPPGTVTISEAAATGWQMSAITVCDDTEIESAGGVFSVELEPGQNITCDVENERTISVEKSANDPVPTGVDGEYTMSYDIAVTNDGPVGQEVTLVDEFLFGASVSQDPVPTATAPDGVTLADDWDGEGQPQLTEPFIVPADTTLEFTVSIVVNVEPDSEDYCPETDTTSSSGALNNVARVVVEGEVIAEDAGCVELEPADLSVTKTVDEGPTLIDDDGDLYWTITYLIEVDNEGNGTGEYSLTDFPDFGDRAEPVAIQVVDSQTDDESYDDNFCGCEGVDVADEVVIGGGGHHEYLVTVEFYIGGPASGTDECNEAEGNGLYNTIEIYWAQGYDESWACEDIPASHLSYDKDVAGVGYPAADEVAVTYELTVSNVGDEGSPAYPEQYFFLDSPLSTLGIEPVDFEVTDVSGGVEGEDYEWEYGTELGMYSEGYLEPDATHVYTVVVTYAVDTEGSFWGECTELTWDSPASGLTNVLIYNLDFLGLPVSLEGMAAAVVEEEPEPQGPPFDFTYACTPVSQVTFEKTVINDDGGTLEAEDVEFQIKDGDELLQSGNTGDTVVVEAGEYTIAEVPVDGYTSDGLDCEVVDGGPEDGDQEEWENQFEAGAVNGYFELDADYEYLCSVTNDDDPVDLTIDKSDGGATFVAGGGAVTYTLKVTNEGGFSREGDDAVVADRLPEGLVWVPGSVTGCTSVVFADRTMTCRIASADLVPGAEVVITAQAKLPAAGASGEYTNLAWVDIDAQMQPERILDCESDNADCETTPAVRQATITATKVSDAVGPKRTGDAVAYTLTVSNAGPSTLLPGTVLTDDLPEGLQFVSVSAPGWVCNNADPVVCSSDADVNPGSSLPSIVINTKVTATGNVTITNTGVFTAIVDTEDEVLPSGFGATAAVTVEASASAVASIVIDQGSAPPVTGPLPVTGGSPEGILYSALGAFAIGAFLLRLRRLRPQA